MSGSSVVSACSCGDSVYQGIGVRPQQKAPVVFTGLKGEGLELGSVEHLWDKPSTGNEDVQISIDKMAKPQSSL